MLKIKVKLVQCDKVKYKVKFDYIVQSMDCKYKGHSKNASISQLDSSRSIIYKFTIIEQDSPGYYLHYCHLLEKKFNPKSGLNYSRL